eukprot:54306-Pelagomonas_calceolata.AAC.11
MAAVASTFPSTSVQKLRHAQVWVSKCPDSELAHKKEATEPVGARGGVQNGAKTLSMSNEPYAALRASF